MSVLSSKMFLKAPPVAVTAVPDEEESTITKEIEAYDAISIATDASNYVTEEGRIDLNAFWSDHQRALPIHYLVYLGDCASTL